MFGHQDEPQQPVTSAPTMPVAADQPIPDAVLDDLVTTSAPAVPAPTPLIEAHETDGLVATPATFSPVSPSALSDPAPVATPTSTDTLLDIKQQALQQLSPLVGHLEQSAEEKFRTTMMMIQAADNQDLIGQAYEAAQAIVDEKARAQALLDIVNEINYFTQRQAK